MEVMKGHIESLNLEQNCDFYFDGIPALERATELIQHEFSIKLEANTSLKELVI